LLLFSNREYEVILTELRLYLVRFEVSFQTGVGEQSGSSDADLI
jgi:hypothetical protein